MDKEAKNYFNLTDAEDWLCSLSSFRNWHSNLIINLKHKEFKDRRIAFILPIYFEGPTFWHGANFVLGTEDELMDLLSSWSEVDADPPKGYLLFKVFNGKKEIRIVAMSAHVLQSGESDS